MKKSTCHWHDFQFVSALMIKPIIGRDTKTKNRNQKTKNDEYKNTKRNNENAEKKTNKTWKRRQKEKGNHLLFPSLSPQQSSHKYLSTFLIQSFLVSKHFLPLYRRKSTCYRVFFVHRRGCGIIKNYTTSIPDICHGRKNEKAERQTRREK